MNSYRRIKIGIIGAGGIANTHARYYRQHPWGDLVAVADIVPGKAAEFAKRWEIPEDRAFDDYHQMLETVEREGVSICTYAVRDGLPSPIDPRGIFLTNVVMDSMLRSAERGGEVQVDCSY